MKIKNLMLATIAILVLLFTGCATNGATALKDETKTTLRKKLFVGKTTKNEVISMYGQPQNIKKTKSGETYVYVLSKTHSGDLFHSFDKKDLNNVVEGAAAGAVYGGAKLGVLTAGGNLAAGRLGQATNKSDQSVDKSLIIKFNSRGIVRSYSLH